MASYLALRDLDLATLPDPEGGPDLPADGRPVLPAGWTCEPIPTTPAPSWECRKGGDVLLVVKCNEAGGRGLFLVRGPKAFLDGLDNAEVAPAKEIYRLALAGPGTPRNIMRAWRWWRCDVTEPATQEDVDAGAAVDVGDPIQRDGVVRELTAEGVLLPDPTASALPWDLDADGNEVPQASAVRRVRALGLPALSPGGTPWTMAGAGDHVAIENEEDRGA